MKEAERFKKIGIKAPKGKYHTSPRIHARNYHRVAVSVSPTQTNKFSSKAL